MCLKPHESLSTEIMYTRTEKKFGVVSILGRQVGVLKLKRFRTSNPKFGYHKDHNNGLVTK